MDSKYVLSNIEYVLYCFYQSQFDVKIKGIFSKRNTMKLFEISVLALTHFIDYS